MINDFNSFKSRLSLRDVNTTIRDPFLELITDLESLQSNVSAINYIAGNMSVIQSNITATQKALLSLHTSTIYLLGDLSGNDHPITNATVKTWRSNRPIAVPGLLDFTLTSVTNVSTPDGVSTTLTISSYNLSSYLTEARTKAYSLTKSILDLVDEKAIDVTTKVSDSIKGFHESLIGSLEGTTRDINVIISSGIPAIQSGFLSVTLYDGYRNSGYIVIGILGLVFAWGLGPLHFTQSKRLIQIFETTGIFLFISAYIFVILLLVLSVTIGGTCDALFLEKGSGPLELLDVAYYFKLTLNFRDECHKNTSLIQAASTLNLVAPEMSNVTETAQTELKKQDFSGITGWTAEYESFMNF